jgi:GTP cyclohydrolase I
MKTKCRDIAAFMEVIAPADLAEDWDNVGMMLGGMDKTVERILVCLDVTSGVAAEADKKKADLIISHHPLIFSDLKRILKEDSKGNVIYTLISNGISVFSAHTNLDAAENGVNVILAEKLRLERMVNLKDYDINQLDSAGKKYGLGKIGYLKEPQNLSVFIQSVKTLLEIDDLRLVGSINKPIEKVAVFCGSYDNDLKALERHHIDILVTGDIKYHTAVEALEMGICIVDAGHFNTEKIILPELAKLISNKFPDIEVFCSNMEKDPFKTY